MGKLAHSDVRPIISWVYSELMLLLPLSNMLYHLVSLVPGRDITLHVSTNNPAMVRGLLFLCHGANHKRPPWVYIGTTVTLQSIRVQG
jgi:hypothetical protein